MKTLIILSVLFSLVGCATCGRHPVVCTIAGAIVVGSIAATIQANDKDRDQRQISRTPGPQVRP